MKININEEKFSSIYKFLFKASSIEHIFFNKIIKQLKNFVIDRPIETTAYPFVIEERIKIHLSDKEENNLFKFFVSNNLVEKEYIIELKELHDNLLNNLIAIYHNKPIKIKNFSELIFEIDNYKNRIYIYIKIVIKEFSKKEENRIRDYCYAKTEEHVDKKAGIKTKNKKKTQKKSKGIGGPK